MQHLNPSSFRINISQQLKDAIIGMIFLYLYLKKELKNCLKEQFSTIILLSINYHHTDSQMLYFSMCVCMCFSFSSLLYISHIFFIVNRVYTFLFFSLLT